MGSKDRVTRVELEQKLADMEAKVNDIKVLAAELEGGKRRKLEETTAKLSADVKQLQVQMAGTASELHTAFKRLDSLVRTVKELVTANNSASIVLNCVEAHLDLTAEGWDGGVRAETEKRAALLRERAEIAQRAQRRGKDDETPLEDRRAEAVRLWEISRELGSEGSDVPMVLSLYLQARDVDDAVSFVEEVKASDLKIEGELAELMDQLVARIEELRKDLEAGELKSVPAPEPVDASAEEEARESLAQMRAEQAKRSFDDAPSSD